jgi:hypothetical protein
MAFDQTKILSGRNFKLYTVAWHASVIPPADTVAYGTAWGTPAGQTGAWVEAGYTEGGLTFTAEVTRGEIRVDQELDPVLRPATGRNLTMSTQLAEFTGPNIKASTGQGAITTVAACSGTRGHDDLDISSTIADNYLSVGFDISHPGDSEAFRVFGWKTLPGGGFTGTVTPTDKAVIAFSAQLLPDTSTSPARIMKIRDVIPALP